MKSGTALLALILLCTLASSEAQEKSQAASTGKDASSLLAEADRLAWLFNWPTAGPLY